MRKLKFLLETFRDSLRICGRRSKEELAFLAAGNTERRRDDRTTMRCALVLTFWTAILVLILLGLMYGGPRLWTILGNGVFVRAGA